MVRTEVALARGLVLAEAAGSSDFLATVQAIMAEFALARSDTANAVRLGRDLVQRMAATRRLSLLACGLALALLAADELPAARETARLGWGTGAAPRADLEIWALLLALLAAREGRLRTSARLLGSASTLFAAHSARMGPNEMRAADEAARIVGAALDAGEVERLRRAGQALGEDQIGALAFAADDI